MAQAQRQRQVIIITAALGVLAASMLIVAAPAAAVAEPSLITDKVTIAVTGDERWGVAHLIIGNDGERGDVTIHFVDERTGNRIPLRRQGAPAADGYTMALPKQAFETVTLQVKTGLAALDGHVVVQPTGGGAIGVPFRTARKPADWWLWLPCLGAVLAVLVIVGAWVSVHSRERPKLSQQLGVAIDWKSNSSWASNVTALSAVTGTVLGLSGFLDDVLHGVVVTRFVGLNALMVAVLASSPLVFAALAKQHRDGQQGEGRVGTVAGFLVASWLTLSAALGELVVLALMLHMARAEKGAWLITGMLAMAIIVLALYGWRSIADALTFRRSFVARGVPTQMTPEEAKANPAGARLSLL